MKNIKEIVLDELSYFIKFLEGKEPLWLAYWIHFVLLGYGLSKIADVGFIKDSVLFLSMYLIFFIIFGLRLVFGVVHLMPNKKFGVILHVLLCA